MDHDSHEIRIAAVEAFLDANAHGWREKDQWRRMRGDDGGDRYESGWREPKEALVVDEDQTKRDRRALGLDHSAEDAPNAPDTPAPNTEPPAQQVAIGAANASPETQAALETQQDPARADAAAAQREEKAAHDAAGGVDPASVKPTS